MLFVFASVLTACVFYISPSGLIDDLKRFVAVLTEKEPVTPVSPGPAPESLLVPEKAMDQALLLWVKSLCTKSPGDIDWKAPIISGPPLSESLETDLDLLDVVAESIRSVFHWRTGKSRETVEWFSLPSTGKTRYVLTSLQLVPKSSENGPFYSNDSAKIRHRVDELTSSFFASIKNNRTDYQDETLYGLRLYLPRQCDVSALFEVYRDFPGSDDDLYSSYIPINEWVRSSDDDVVFFGNSVTAPASSVSADYMNYEITKNENGDLEIVNRIDGNYPYMSAFRLALYIDIEQLKNNLLDEHVLQKE